LPLILDVCRRPVKLSVTRLKEKMSDVESTFQVVRDLLEQGGFRHIENLSHPETFRSRYAVFGRGSYGVRLIWDGTEERNLFQEQLGKTGDAWEDVMTIRVEFEPLVFV